MSWMPDFSGAGESLGDVSGGGGAFLGGFEDAAPADGGGALGGLGGDIGSGGSLSPLAQMFLQGQQVPEVQADPSSGIDYGDWSPAGSPGGAQAGGMNAVNSAAAGIKSAGSEDGFLQKVMKGLGLSGKDGSIDLSDPKQMQAWLKVLMAGGGIGSALFHRTATGYKSPQDLLNSTGGGTPAMKWNPGQQASADQFFGSGATPWTQRPFSLAQPGNVEQPGRHYAMGGGVGYAEGGAPRGALSQVAGGQDDVIDAKLAPGEFVWDADTVSALGDGSNEAGAKKLEEFRQAIRAHKRSAPPDRIPPRARPINQYMPKGGK